MNVKTARRLFFGAAIAQLAVLFLYHVLVDGHLHVGISHGAHPSTLLSPEIGTASVDNVKQEGKPAAAAGGLDKVTTRALQVHPQERTPARKEIDAFVKRLPKQTYLGKRRICNNSTKPCLLYMHIGKSGGTSFGELALKIANSTGRHFEGVRHFDWSFVSALGSNVQVLTMLREPVSRAISHFHFVQDSHFGLGTGLGEGNGKNMTLSMYFADPSRLMFETRDIWQDGQAAVSWLTGTHIAAWVGTPGSQVTKREQMAMSLENMPIMLHLAANRLEETLWFGLLEDSYKSLELLQHVTLSNTTKKEDGEKHNQQERLAMPSKNVAVKKHAAATPLEVETMKSLMPQDLWLYEYAKRLFAARWKAYITNAPVVLPERPPLPKLPCHSFRFNLTCVSGPLKGTYWYDQNIEADAKAR
jgi:hypothetical protein